MDGSGKPGTWWLVAAAGVGLLLVARIVYFSVTVADIPARFIAPAILFLLADLAVAVGLAASALRDEHLSWGHRVALLLGALFFANPFGAFGSLSMFR